VTQNKSRSEKIDIVMRVIRSSVGVFLIIVIATSFLVPHVLAVSGKSIVNAKLEWIRTPINGNVSFGNIRLGDSVSKDQVLGEVTNTRAEDSLLNSLQLESSALNTAIFDTDNRHRQLSEQKSKLSDSVHQSLLQLRQQTELKINTIETELLSAERKRVQLRSQIQRYEAANEEYSEVTEVEAYISNQKNALKLLATELQSAITGEFSSKNTPLEQQKLKDLEQATANIATERQALLMKSEQLLKDIEVRTASLDLNKREEFTARVDGVIWDIGYADGSYVQNGDALVAIADTDSLVVECIFHQRYLDSISVGDFASINLMGSNEKMTGKVEKVLIRDPVRSSNLSAFKFSSPENNEFKVLITIDSNQDSAPRIGQRAKVVISKSKTSLISKLLLALSR